MSDAEQMIRRSITDSMEVHARLLETHLAEIARIADLLVDTFRANGKVVLFGNGGSAADAQHVAAELVNRLHADREALPAIALTCNTSILTSVPNDIGFEQVFARQVKALVQEGDVAVGISTSGNSPNVLEGIRAAAERGATTLGFTGQDGGELKALTDTCLCVPSNSTPRIQEAHIAVWHAICAVVERTLFG